MKGADSLGLDTLEPEALDFGIAGAARQTEFVPEASGFVDHGIGGDWQHDVTLSAGRAGPGPRGTSPVGWAHV
ncbi:hypothetical protein K8P10_001493 [Leucobacter sp. Psy1]|nr:hypothetical protein K8P10_001493 [Leucobacter sp. Psy1]